MTHRIDCKCDKSYVAVKGKKEETLTENLQCCSNIRVVQNDVICLSCNSTIYTHEH